MKAKLKKLVEERAMWCCEYCLAQALFSANVFSIEHIIPASKGGITEIQDEVQIEIFYTLEKLRRVN
jgi:uncharacterized protein YjfI (DUF2170 family)